MTNYEEYAKRDETRTRFYFRMNDAEKEMVEFIMEKENIPDRSKAIRFCIWNKYATLKHQQGADQ